MTDASNGPCVTEQTLNSLLVPPCPLETPYKHSLNTPDLQLLHAL